MDEETLDNKTEVFFDKIEIIPFLLDSEITPIYQDKKRLQGENGEAIFDLLITTVFKGYVNNKFYKFIGAFQDNVINHSIVFAYRKYKIILEKDYIDEDLNTYYYQTLLLNKELHIKEYQDYVKLDILKKNFNFSNFFIKNYMFSKKFTPICKDDCYLINIIQIDKISSIFSLVYKEEIN